ncbi:SpoIIE family protein phosphatase [Phycicoccus sp. CSK15P-2]|uniref:PP2C family protein-serine/threonine phosphatase n=1 Tax=Phycicoccus sp. CSK15P-2 TaxID=2807627 RepID=UPI001951D461|nr:SpoIIE family protein phosphatase [Phycicoccus sp. CSK15P-2]MBM6405289.1 SpoIIE family protein phosphatase [Phycicoccus sp. CSK15P-2]
MPSHPGAVARSVHGDPQPSRMRGDRRFEPVVRLAQRLFDVPMVSVNLVDDSTLTRVACVGLDGSPMPREESFCATVVDDDAGRVVPDLTLDDRFAVSPHVTDAGLRFYAGEPLHSRSGAAVGTLCLLDSRTHDFSDEESLLLRDLADWVERELARDAEAEQARRIQRRLLPRKAPEIPGYALSGGCRPAQGAGGDLYDWMTLPDGTVQLVVADVMGKGMEGTVVAAGLRAILRGASRFIPLVRLLGRLEAFLDDDDDEQSVTFVTMFLARLRPDDGGIEYVDAGHGLAFVVGAGGEPRRLTAVDPPVGVVPGTDWHVGRDHLAPGETLVVVSDGALDAFPDVPSALRAGVELCTSTPDVREVVAAVTAVGGSVPDDDVTAVVVRRAGP